MLSDCFQNGNNHTCDCKLVVFYSWAEMKKKLPFPPGNNFFMEVGFY